MMAMRNKAITALFCLLLTSTAVLSIISLVEANFHFVPPDIAINSPANGATYNSSDVFVDLMITAGGSFPYGPTFAICLLDGGNPINMTFLNNRDLGWFGKGTFNHVSQGRHTLTVEVHVVTFGNTELIYNVGSTFNVDLSTPTPAPTPTPTPTPSPTATPFPTQSPTPSSFHSPSPMQESTIEPTLSPNPTAENRQTQSYTLPLTLFIAVVLTGAASLIWIRRTKA